MPLHKQTANFIWGCGNVSRRQSCSTFTSVTRHTLASPASCSVKLPPSLRNMQAAVCNANHTSHASNLGIIKLGPVCSTHLCRGAHGSWSVSHTTGPQQCWYPQVLSPAAVGNRFQGCPLKPPHQSAVERRDRQSSSSNVRHRNSHTWTSLGHSKTAVWIGYQTQPCKRAACAASLVAATAHPLNGTSRAITQSKVAPQRCDV